MLETPDLIARIIAAKEGNTEFLLTSWGEGKWQAAIGNRSNAVAIGEAITYGDDQVDFCAEGTTAEETLAALLAKIT